MQGVSRRGRRFTFVELIVATALMTILTASVVFIFIQATAIFTTVDAKVQVYQYARYAFDQMERDFANVAETRNMEFFNDRAPPAGVRGLYEEGEAVPITGTANTLRDEILGDDIYNHGFTVRRPKTYPAWDDPTRRYHRDSIYFKTVTVLDGKPQAALVEYAMVDTHTERPRLQKRVWRITGVGADDPLRPRYQVARQTQDLCRYVVDTRFEIFTTNRRTSRPGDYYDVDQLLAPPTLVQATGERPFERHRNYWPGGALGRYKMHQCYYDPTHDGGDTPDAGVFTRDAPGDPILFHTKRHFGFPQLKAGDRIFLWGAGASFKAKAYTIKAFLRKPPSGPITSWKPGAPKEELRIQFEERLEPTFAGGHTEVNYAAAWVPAAVRVKLVIKDAKSLQERSFARVFKILAR